MFNQGDTHKGIGEEVDSKGSLNMSIGNEETSTIPLEKGR